MEGNIFDIQPFALHDGPGIRTTVFLKGCPLRCQWCCNPESFTSKPILSYNLEKCIQCHECVPHCKSDALSISENGTLQVKHELCTNCGECIKNCPTGALKIYGYTMSSDDILDRIIKDKVYFDKSGGGITLSGGEVMMQTAFSTDLLKKAKEKGLHTCIETSGFAQQSEYKKIAPYVDLFLFDYKITGKNIHKKYTAQDNNKILSNLDFLNSIGAQIH
ncbi:MAG: glycyl-radical enzyme activating protein [Prolixibacteraceae bacterium]